MRVQAPSRVSSGPSHLGPGMLLVVSKWHDKVYVIRLREVLYPIEGQGWVCETKEGNRVLVGEVGDQIANVRFMI